MALNDLNPEDIAHDITHDEAGDAVERVERMRGGGLWPFWTHIYAQGDPLPGDPIALGQRPAQGRVRGVRVAVDTPDHALRGLHHLRQGPEGGLVGGQHGHVAGELVGASHRIDRDPADALREFDGHGAYCAESRSALNTRASLR